VARTIAKGQRVTLSSPWAGGTDATVDPPQQAGRQQHSTTHTTMDGLRHHSPPPKTTKYFKVTLSHPSDEENQTTRRLNRAVKTPAFPFNNRHWAS
jgi:hypothetical protein